MNTLSEYFYNIWLLIGCNPEDTRNAPSLDDKKKSAGHSSSNSKMRESKSRRKS